MEFHRLTEAEIPAYLQTVPAMQARFSAYSVAAHLATFMARSLFHGSDLYLAPAAKRDAVKRFTNVELCKITED